MCLKCIGLSVTGQGIHGFGLNSRIPELGIRFAEALHDAAVNRNEEAWKEISNEIIFDFNDSSGLAKILVRLMVDNNFRDSIIKSVRSYALKTSWDVIARVHTQLYKSL